MSSLLSPNVAYHHAASHVSRMTLLPVILSRESVRIKLILTAEGQVALTLQCLQYAFCGTVALAK